MPVEVAVLDAVPEVVAELVAEEVLVAVEVAELFKVATADCVILPVEVDVADIVEV